MFLEMDCQKRNDIVIEGDRSIFSVYYKNCNKYKKDALIRNGYTNQVNQWKAYVKNNADTIIIKCIDLTKIANRVKSITNNIDGKTHVFIPAINDVH